MPKPRSGAVQLVSTEQLAGSFPLLFLDVSGDGLLSALDALQVINLLNARDFGREPLEAGEPTSIAVSSEVASTLTDEEEPLDEVRLNGLTAGTKWVSVSVDDRTTEPASAIHVPSEADHHEPASSSDSQLLEWALDEWFSELGKA